MRLRQQLTALMFVVADVGFGCALSAQSAVDPMRAADLMSQAHALLTKHTPESLRSAIDTYDEARQIWIAAGDKRKQMEVLFETAQAYFLLHEIEKEIKPLEQARSLAEALGDPDSEGRALFTTARCYEALRDTARSLKAYQQALTVFRASRNDLQVGRVLLASGEVYQTLQADQDHQTAADYFKQATVLLQNAGDRFNAGLAWWALGNVEDGLNRREGARDAFASAVPLVIATNTPMVQGMVLGSLGHDQNVLKEYGPAIVSLERALPLLKSPSTRKKRFIALLDLGMAHEALGQMATALEAYQTASAESEATGDFGDAGLAELKIGAQHRAADERQSATESYLKALKFFQQSGSSDRTMEATALTALASNCARLGDYRKSLEYDLLALPLLNGDSVRFQRAVTLYTIGDAYNALHEGVKALDYLQRALNLYDEGAEGRAGVLASIGEVYADRGDRKAALEKYQDALDIAHKFGDPATETKILNDIALDKEWLTGREDAERILVGLLRSAQQRKDVQQEAATTNNLGELARFYGDAEEAKSLYLRSLALNRQIGDKYSQAHNLSGLAGAYSALGEEQKAFDALNEAMTITRQLADRGGEVKVLNDLARLYGDRGEYARSLETYNRALDLVSSEEDPDSQATLLNGIASTYADLGVVDIAKDYYSRALQIHKRLGDDFNTGLLLNNLAVLAQRAGESTEALVQYNEALNLARKMGNKLGQSRLLSSESILYQARGETPQALANLEHALQLGREINDVDSQALAIHNRAGLRAETGDVKGAIADYESALKLWRVIAASSEQATCLFAKAKLESKKGDIDSALRDASESIRLANATRGTAGTADLRASLTAASSHFSELEVDLLMRLNATRPGQGYDVQAFEASERGRARSLIEMLRESRLQLDRQIDSKLRIQQKSLESAINVKAAAQMKLANSMEAQAEQDRLDSEIRDLRVKLDKVEAQIREKDPAYAALTEPPHISYRQIQNELIDKETLLLEYSLGEEHSYLWAVDARSLHSYVLPKRSEIESAAREFDDLVSGHEDNPAALAQAAAALSTELFGPVAAELRNKRLIVVADGELNRVPLAIVPDPESPSGEPLLVRHEFVNEPSASVLVVERRILTGRTPAPKRLALIADPVFQADDERLRERPTKPVKAESPILAAAQRDAGSSQAEIVRLPYTREEANRILKHVPLKEALLLTGLDANKTEVQGPKLSQYRMVHFATHGLLNPNHPELSGLVLSLYDARDDPVDGFLRLNEIYNLKLPAELVVLSACESGRGKLLSGEGVVGLTRGFLYAGAKTLAVSLWSVNDASTAELMARFYAGMMGKKHLRPAAALRAAQLSMRTDTQWSNPYYWAAFTIQGDWR